MMVCAICGHDLVEDGFFVLHAGTDSMYGEDGHAVVPITRAAYLAALRETPGPHGERV